MGMAGESCEPRTKMLIVLNSLLLLFELELDTKTDEGLLLRTGICLLEKRVIKCY